MLTILAGNTPMERRARGPRGAPVLARFATLSVLAIPLLWNRQERVASIHVRSATRGDLEEMASVWQRYAPTRQLSSVLKAETLASWIAAAPGLAVNDYLIAIDGRGRLLGFMGVWDQTDFKQMRVVSYSPRLALARRGINLIAPLAGAAPLPDRGGALPALATVHVCAEEPRVLRALLLEAYRQQRSGRFSFLTLGLDVSDPLKEATRGLLAQPTLVHAYITSPRGSADPAQFSGRPLHHETALV